MGQDEDELLKISSKRPSHAKDTAMVLERLLGLHLYAREIFGAIHKTAPC
jgi:hypothetical protein